MPPRRRPKLKPFSIVCALPDCGLVKVRYYPRRPSVAARANRGGRTYCSKAHAQRDWERRRRHEAAETTTCAWRGCAHEIPPTHRPGRPRSYCSDRCKAAAARDRARPIPNALATAQAQAATAREKAAPARREADEFRGRLDATEAAAKAAARYPARLLAWEQAEPKPPGPRVFPSRVIRCCWRRGAVASTVAPPARFRRSSMPKPTGGRKGNASASMELARYEVDHERWQEAKPTPSRPPGAEALRGWRAQLVDLERVAVAAADDLEQAEAAVEHVRKRLAKRAADAKARRADAKAAAPPRPSSSPPPRFLPPSTFALAPDLPSTTNGYAASRPTDRPRRIASRGRADVDDLLVTRAAIRAGDVAAAGPRPLSWSRHSRGRYSRSHASKQQPHTRTRSRQPRSWSAGRSKLRAGSSLGLASPQASQTNGRRAARIALPPRSWSRTRNT